MLKIIVIATLSGLVLFIVACLGLALLMTLIVVTIPKEKEDPLPRRTSDVAPLPDAELFRRLANEAMAYATRPNVTTIVDVNGVFLLVTASDAFGKRVYAESRRRIGKCMHAVICVYEAGNHAPAASAAIEIPASQVDWSSHFRLMQDVAEHGPLMTCVDHFGRRREIRIPKKRSYHA